MTICAKWLLGVAAAGIVALAAPVVAADHGSGGGAPHGGGSPFGGPAAHGGSGPHGGGSIGMPPHGYHGAPPDFHGSYPHGGPGGAGRPGGAPGGHPPEHFDHRGTFHGHNFDHFTPDERHAWEGGVWRHEYHDGHLGWWWFVGGLWFYYPAPVYPYPLYVGPDSYYDYYDEYGAPSYYWYYCEDPPGYYPYVQHCNGPWQPVPPAPYAD